MGETEQPAKYPGGIKPNATSLKLGWVGLQAFRYHNLSSNEVWVPSLRITDERLEKTSRLRPCGSESDSYFWSMTASSLWRHS
jgi:hypothetical protein